MRSLVPAILLTLVVGAIRPIPLCADVTADDVRSAIDDGVEYLRNQQNEDGSWPAEINLHAFSGGVTSLCTLALLNSGVPAADPAIQRALTNLRTLDPKWTYVVALQTMAFCRAEPEKDRLLIERNVEFLESIQKREGSPGAWTYGDGMSGRGDNSNAQFALLALHEAERIGVKTSEATWRLARDYWSKAQNPDGSWGYLVGRPGTGSMTCAGIAVMIMAADKLEPGDARVEDDRVECCGEQTSNEAVERGLQWLALHFNIAKNPGDQLHSLYYLYAMERVGRLTNHRLIGKHDWYREGAEILLSLQAGRLAGFDRGSWVGTGPGESQPIIGTSMALLFLSKGRRPVLATKLDFGPADHWNRHRRDLENLTHYCERQWKRELTWQAVESRSATVDDLIQAPVLFISGSKTPELKDAEVRAVREYLDRGGFVFAEACCDSVEFDAGFRSWMDRIFPERDDQDRPRNGLRLLPADHPVWRAEETVDPRHLSALYGIDIGGRTRVIYCPENLGCYWEAAPIHRAPYPPLVEEKIRAARSIGINVMTYATNREVKYKLEVPQFEPAPK